jgi:hypothetical protein
MIERELKNIAEADLQKLIDDPVREGKTIEYKVELNLKTDDAKRKFLAGIASFANASGGDMVLGIKTDSTDKALPIALQPLAGFNPDADVLMLQEIIRRHIEPKVFTLDFHPVPITGGWALIIRIRKTWAGAHMVTYNDDFRFYTRHQGGRRPMDVPEIRSAFTLAETTMEKINRYRLERLGNILAGETPVTLGGKAIIVLHLCPLRSFDPAYQVNLNPLREPPHDLPLLYIHATWWGDDFDGYLAANRPDRISSGFTYAFKNGCIEAVDTGILEPRGEGKLEIPSGVFDCKLLEQTGSLFSTLNTIGAEPPVVLMLSILRAKGYTFLLGPRYNCDGSKPINRDQLLLPPVIVENLDPSFDNAATLLRPLLDAIWNACGYERSLNFDGAGKWAPL